MINRKWKGPKHLSGGENQLELECRGVCHGWKVCLFYRLKWRENSLYKTSRGTWISRVQPLLENSFALISSPQQFWSCSSSSSPAGCLSAKAVCLFLLIPFNLLFFYCSLIYTPHINYTDKPVLPALKAKKGGTLTFCFVRYHKKGILNNKIIKANIYLYLTRPPPSP